MGNDCQFPSRGPLRIVTLSLIFLAVPHIVHGRTHQLPAEGIVAELRSDDAITVDVGEGGDYEEDNHRQQVDYSERSCRTFDDKAGRCRTVQQCYTLTKMHQRSTICRRGSWAPKARAITSNPPADRSTECAVSGQKWVGTTKRPNCCRRRWTRKNGSSAECRRKGASGRSWRVYILKDVCSAAGR